MLWPRSSMEDANSSYGMGTSSSRSAHSPDSSAQKRSVILDGEIVCLDRTGSFAFTSFCSGVASPASSASTCCTVTYSPLVERKHRLRDILPENSQSVLFCDHIEGVGEESLVLNEHDKECEWPTGSHFGTCR